MGYSAGWNRLEYISGFNGVLIQSHQAALYFCFLVGDLLGCFLRSEWSGAHEEKNSVSLHQFFCFVFWKELCKERVRC